MQNIGIHVVIFDTIIAPSGTLVHQTGRYVGNTVPRNHCLSRLATRSV